MLSGLFDPENVSVDNKYEMFAPISQKTKKLNAALDLELPPIKRSTSEFSGLMNQGATCYLNSLFQALYFSPEFRSLVFSIDLDKLSAYEKDSQKYNIIREFQKFFARLKFMSYKNHETSVLTECFGWSNADGADQQDFAEAARIIADTIERAVFEAGMTEKLQHTLKGTNVNYINCMTCQNERENNGEFYDLILPIRNFQGHKFTSIEESVSFILSPEMMDGPNQYACEICHGKTDALKGQRFARLPDLLTVSLMRFDFNYDTFERMKINDYFKFDLRLDMSIFTGNKDEVYDLFGVIVHRGDAYGGHYHAIIRDSLLEEQTIEFDQQTLMSDAENNIEAPPAAKRTWLPEAKPLPQDLQDRLKGLFTPITNLDKYGQKVDEKKKDKKKKKGEAETEEAKDKDDCSDPFPTKLKRDETTEYLFNNWWDFDDSRVNRVDVNRLSKYFGNNKENAYILMYRKTSLNANNEKLRAEKPPQSVLDDIKKEESIRRDITNHYEAMKNKIHLNVRHVDEAYDFDNDKIRPGKGKTVEVWFNDTLKTLRSKVREALGLPDGSRFVLITHEDLPNGTVQFASIITDVPGWEESFFLVKELYMYHDSDYILVPVDHPQYASFKNKITIANTKVRVKVKVHDQEYTMFVPKYATNQELTDTFKPLADWDLELKDVFIVDYGEKKSLKDLTKVQRSLGIRHDDCEFVLRKYDVNLCLNKELVSTQAGLQLIGESDFQLASTENRVSILVWRDETGFNAPFRFLVDPDIVLEKLLNLLKDAFDIPSSSQRRLRDLFNNKLYTKSDLEVSLKDIRDREYNGQKSLGERIKLEAGTVPKAGGFVCTAKLDIFDQTGEKVKLQEDFTYTLTDTVRDLLEKACVALKVEQEDYSLYTCNWADEPVKRLKDLSATAEDESLTEDCTLKLMHYTQGTSDEIRTYEIFYSASGFPGDMKKIGKIAINENQHVEELKNKIKELCTPEQGFETPFQNSHVIVRKLNKIEKPTKALPDGSKSIKRLKVNCTGLVFTVYDHDVQANDNDLRIFIRKRIGKGYANFEEVILHE